MVPTDFYIDTVEVQTPTDSTFGPGWSTPVAVQCYVHDQEQVVETDTGTDADERHTKLHADPADAASFGLGARVTYQGRVSRVVSVSNRVHPINPALNHVVVMLA